MYVITDARLNAKHGNPTPNTTYYPNFPTPHTFLLPIIPTSHTSYCILHTSYFRLPTPHSLLPTSYFRLPTPHSLLPTPYSLLPTPCSLLPASLLPAPYFLLPTDFLLRAGRSIGEAVSAAIAGGATIVQVRQKDVPGLLPTSYSLYSLLPTSYFLLPTSHFLCILRFVRRTCRVAS